MLKRRVNWKRVNARKLLEKHRGMRYKQLFDAKYDSAQLAKQYIFLCAFERNWRDLAGRIREGICQMAA
jgi:hypothetical protein